MAAYNIDKITKQFPQIWKKKKAKELIKSHHIAAIVSDNIVLTPNGRFSYTEEYDYVNQNTRISFGKNCDNIKTEKQQEELSRVSWLPIPLPDGGNQEPDGAGQCQKPE